MPFHDGSRQVGSGQQMTSTEIVLTLQVLRQGKVTVDRRQRWSRSSVFQVQIDREALAYSSNGPSLGSGTSLRPRSPRARPPVVDPRQHEVWPRVLCLVAPERRPRLPLVRLA